VARVARSEATVLITGESGTGKERLARRVHDNSQRAHAPFVAVHVAALAEGVLESELFGHERGAFTGAERRHAGRFESARGGTLFLDEIGEILPRTQVMLLRVLQERVLTRVGGSEDLPVDVRVVAATNRDLEAQVAAGRFREDLYYRLDVVHIHVPPLRERREDIPLLIAHFLERSATRYGMPVPELPPEVGRVLLAHDWPGNVRELENVVERLLVMSAGGRLSVDDLPARVLKAPALPLHAFPDGDMDLTALLDDMERTIVGRALERAGGNKAQAARSLALTREGLRYKLQKYGLDDR